MGAFLRMYSPFGKAMNRCGIIFGANLLFVLFSLTVLLAGPAWVALYHVLLKAYRDDWEVSVLREFWYGFKSNFKQAMVAWLSILLFLIVSIADIRYLTYIGESVRYLRYLIYLIAAFVLVLTLYLFPVMAVFSDTLPHLLRNAFYFAGKNPVRMIGVLLLGTVPFLLTYADLQRLPLYSFLWAFCGFALLAMIISRLLYRDFMDAVHKNGCNNK
ncbi:MAG: DUF624 domain-containing protein [Lachnospiraceae bacterium]|nr:DUF624 domain-containing protein [Lachnospiraceae bacterium]